MKPWIIVGGGMAGLVAARLLEKSGIPFQGLEASEQLGGRARIGHHRVYESASLDLLSSIVSDVEWERVDDPPRERRKGEWKDSGTEGLDSEVFYLKSPYFQPRESGMEIVDKLILASSEKFSLRKGVLEIHPQEKTILCNDGIQLDYERLVWCHSLEALVKAWKGNKELLGKGIKKSGTATRGINIDMQLKAEIFPTRNTVVFPFRYKDFKLRALGVAPTPLSLHWMIFLEEDFADDREEVAKCVRAFRRELLKEFPQLSNYQTGDRISYLPILSGESPSVLKSLSFGEDVFYLGPQARLADAKEGLRNLDQLLQNAGRFGEWVHEAQKV